MKKRIFALLLVFCLLAAVSMAGCARGGSEGRLSSAGSEPVAVTVYSADVTALSFPAEHGTVCGIAASGGSLLTVEMREDGPALVVLDGTGAAQYETALESGEEAVGSIYGICASPEDGFAVLFESDGSKLSRAFFLARYDANGTLLETVRLQALEEMEAIWGPVMTPEGNWLFWNPRELVALDGTGALLFRTEIPDAGLFTVAGTGDGCFAVVMQNAETGVCPIDTATGTLGALTSTGSDMLCYTRTSSAETVLVNASNALYAYDPATAQSAKLFSWQDASLDSGEILSITALGADLYACLSADNVIFLIQASQQEVERKLITVGAMGNGYATRELEMMVNTFNASSTEYYAEIQYYDDPLQLKTELVAGTAPDVLELSCTGLTLTDSYFTDLLPYIDSDPVLERSGLVENVLESLLVEGKLTSLIPEFEVETIVGRTADVGTESGWTMEDLLALWEEKGEGYDVFPAYLPAQELLLWVCHVSLGQFVDWENLTCDFTDDTFISLLELCKMMPETMNPEKLYPGSEYEETVLLRIEDIQSVEVLETWRRNYGDVALTYIGFPNGSGNSGSFFRCPTGDPHLAIPARTEDKEAAWQFVRELLTEDWQQNVTGLPLLRSELEARLDAALQKEEPVLSEADVAQFLALIEDTELFVHEEDSTISDIIMTEAEPFFEGDKTAAEVAELIQNRAGLYLDEQK